MNIQSFRIQWAKTKHYLAWVIFIGAILQIVIAFPIFLYLFNTHFFNAAIADEFNPVFLKKYTVDWFIVFLDALSNDYAWPAVFSFLIYLVMVPAGMAFVFKINSDSADVKLPGEENKNEKYIEGARFGDIEKYNKKVLPENILCHVGKAAMPREAMMRNLLIWAMSGAGKSTLSLKFLYHIYHELPNMNMLIYDPAPEYTSILYNPEKGDIIFNPADVRSCVWNILDEIEDKSDIDMLVYSGAGS